MATTTLSSKGQIIIPKPIRALHHWEQGQELMIIDTGDGIILKSIKAFKETSLEEVSSCLSYSGPAKSLKEMEDAIKEGVRESHK